ncbi:MAG: mannose-1-phosphate guanylyltransferase [Phocaeicola sp.]
MNNKNHYCIIMGGGIGSRFWPFSRTNLPKQFLDFFGMGQTLIQQTYERYKKIIPQDNIYVTTQIGYKELLKEQLPELSDSQIIVEEVRKSTAPSIAQAACYIKKINPEANIVVAPADHLILKEEAFKEAILKGLEFVKNSPQLLTLGIKPSRPETGYGYIQVDEQKEGDFYKVKTFIEKPQLEFAEVFVQSDEFYWNSGIFLWNVNTILQAFQDIMPEVLEKIECPDRGLETCPNISIDYGIMEKAENVYVQLCDFGWSDLGTWNSLYETLPKDKEQNVMVNCHTLCYDAKNNIIAGDKEMLIVVDDLDGYLVASSGNSLLICKKENEATIRKYVNDVRLKLGDKFV